jgi:glycosyltransferase involved in cell wall biosynthesis
VSPERQGPIKMTPMVSLVLPVHNQADHIGEVTAQYRAALQRVLSAQEIILVPNGCGDDSVAVCEALAKEAPDLHVVRSEEAGWGRAIRRGLSAAQGDLLAYTNSARTSAGDLELIVRYSLANPNVVVKAHRRSRDSWTRKLGSFLYNLECRALLDLPTWDINATPKVFRRVVYETISLTSDGDLIDLELYAKCKQHGVPVLEVPIYSWQRYAGKSTTNYTSAMRMYLGAWQMWRATRNGTH